MAHPKMFDDDDPVLRRVRSLALAHPEAVEKVAHGRPTFRTGKVFAYYGGTVRPPDGGLRERHDQSLLLRAADDEELRALREDPRTFHPAYLGTFGWYGIDLDAETDWAEIGELLEESYRATAPARLVRELGARD